MNSLVSIIIPTKNSAEFLEECLIAIRKQTYKNIEILIIDSGSSDETTEIANKYHAKIIEFISKTPDYFEATAKRNYGVKKSLGEYVYYLDTDMELTNNVIWECLELCHKGCDAIIIPEDSFGTGVWAQAKNLERKCYVGDDTVEAPRFFSKDIWKKVDGLDEKIGGGGDDWDLYQKLLENGYKVERIKSFAKHNEGNLQLGKLFRKRFIYGKETIKYVKKRPGSAAESYFPIRSAYLKHWRLFLSRPKDTASFIIMRTTEYTGGFLGMLYSLFVR